MIVAGCDPGTIRMGIGVIEVNRGVLRFVAAETLSAPAKWPIERRIAMLARDLRAVMAEWAPDVVAYESGAPVGKNGFRSAMALGEARGALLASIGERPAFGYGPTAVKAAVAGGRADKSQVAKAVCRLLGLKGLKGSDAADALAVAVTCARKERFK